MIEPDREPSSKLIDHAPRAKPSPAPNKPKPGMRAAHWDPNALFFDKR